MNKLLKEPSNHLENIKDLIIFQLNLSQTVSCKPCERSNRSFQPRAFTFIRITLVLQC